jgi:hypothetical protein
VGDGVKGELGAVLQVVEERMFARGQRGRTECADLAFPILGESSYDVHVCS